jgi:predicted AlkP superfamily phosphohydrolase/phosphomutase
MRKPAPGREALLPALAGVLVWLFTPTAVSAYVGPGAGFAVLSSFLTLLLAFLYAGLALLLWPVRQLFRLFRRRKALGRARTSRVVVLGFDGMDPDLCTRYMKEGKLPHLAALRDTGTFQPLATTHPPISPVAWATFLTGVLPGKHNIYDFLARDRHTYLPYLSSAQIGEPKRVLKLGRLLIPLGLPRIKLLRKARPFWHYLGDAGVFCSVIRVPITFPPEKFPGVLLSGMCVPDIQGSQGTFSFYSTRLQTAEAHQSGVMIPFERVNGHLRSHIPGPRAPGADGPGALRIPFRLRPDAAGARAVLEINGRSIPLVLGQYSDWIELQYNASAAVRVQGIARFYLKSAAPETELYVTPVNIHPGKPALPISHPLAYSVYLSKLLGPYATLGLAEDTWGLNEGAIGDDAFLEQCLLNHEERERMFFDALEKTPRGLCVCVWDTTDRVQHMFWRYHEPGHPAAGATGANAADAVRLAGVIPALYQRVDRLVGKVRESLRPDDVLFIISDHGFKSFARGFHLNSWLWQNGYLALREGATASGDWFRDVDWSRTRAYGLGLNGLYINQQGRERHGIVAPTAVAALKRELQQKLAGLTDPASGRTAITEVWDDHTVFAGPYRENAPDLLLGYAAGFRASWDTVSGRVTGAIFEDNAKAWSGDHCMDARQVPGILFCNQKLRAQSPAIVDLAPTILDQFGLGPPSHFDGKAWAVDLAKAK